MSPLAEFIHIGVRVSFQVGTVYHEVLEIGLDTYFRVLDKYLLLSKYTKA